MSTWKMFRRGLEVMAVMRRRSAKAAVVMFGARRAAAVFASACVAAFAIAALLTAVGAASHNSHIVREFALGDTPPDGHGSTHDLALGPDGNVWVTQQIQGNSSA